MGGRKARWVRRRRSGASTPERSTAAGGSGRDGEQGAQSLEWLALGSFVATVMGGATLYARDHGGELGSLLLHHLRAVLGQ
jgi:hypothetical protein